MFSIMKSLGILGATVVCIWLWNQYNSVLPKYIDRAVDGVTNAMSY